MSLIGKKVNAHVEISEGQIKVKEVIIMDKILKSEIFNNGFKEKYIKQYEAYVVRDVQVNNSNRHYFYTIKADDLISM